MNLEQLIQALTGVGATRILFKELAPNDNSKNQIYFGGSLDILNVIPMGEVEAETTPRGVPILKSSVEFAWLADDGNLSPAPGAQLILYPQYPEVRFSGFLRGSPRAPNAIMASRTPGRLLVLGIVPSGRVIGWAGTGEHLRDQLRGLSSLSPVGAFQQLEVDPTADAEARLLARLAEISSEGWIDAQRLYGDGRIGPCGGVNCGGYTLEARLGIIPNGRSEPDFEGWEVKAHAVSTFDRLGVGVLTLMTPEPSGGLYKTEGSAAFIRRFGYPDQKVAHRLNFSSPHHFGVRNLRTGLTLTVLGADEATGKITDPHGSIALLTPDDEVAASWPFAKLIEHWSRKHERAAYVPYMARSGSISQFRYGHAVRLGRRTDFQMLIGALTKDVVWHDPGLKLEGADGPAAKTKCRNQFRVRSANLGGLYRSFDEVALF